MKHFLVAMAMLVAGQGIQAQNVVLDSATIAEGAALQYDIETHSIRATSQMLVVVGAVGGAAIGAVIMVFEMFDGNPDAVTGTIVFYGSALTAVGSGVAGVVNLFRMSGAIIKRNQFCRKHDLTRQEFFDLIDY